METIISPLQQRAIDYCDRKQMPKIGRQMAVIAYMHGAEEQDRIARAEERERCIKVAQNFICASCTDGFCFGEQTTCAYIDSMRKSMMED